MDEQRQPDQRRNAAERDELLTAVSDQLQAIRISLGLELEEAALRAHVDVERLAAAEAATAPLDERELQSVADAYGVDVTAFFGGRTTPLAYLFGA